jgi:hypothetical protein
MIEEISLEKFEEMNAQKRSSDPALDCESEGRARARIALGPDFLAHQFNELLAIARPKPTPFRLRLMFVQAE